MPEQTGRRRSLLRRIRSGGWRRVREAIYKSYALRIYHLPTSAIPPLPSNDHNAGIEYRELTLDDWLLLEAALIASGEADPLRVRRRLAQGHRVFCGLHQGRVVHFSHVCASRRALLDVPVDLELRPDERFIYKCYTVPEARGQGIFTRMLREILTSLAREGVCNAYIDVAEGNSPSINAIQAAGFTLLRIFRGRRLLGITFPLRRRVIQIGCLHACAKPVRNHARD